MSIDVLAGISAIRFHSCVAQQDGSLLLTVYETAGTHEHHLAGPLAQALASAAPGELVGPVGTPEGFALVALEERHEPVLDAATRRRLQDELFEGWLAAQLGQATLDSSILGAAGRPGSPRPASP